MANYKAHLDNLTSEKVQSANKALDYLDGYQLYWLEQLLDDEVQGIKDWRERGVYPLINNLTKKVVARSALSYNNPPTRIVVKKDGSTDDVSTEEYNQLTKEGDFDAVMRVADQVTRLLKSCVILTQVVEVSDDLNDDGERLMYNILHRGNCDVNYDYKNGQINSLMYRSGGASPRGHKLYHYWDNVHQIDIEVDSSTVDENNPIGTVTILSKDEHKYGIVPAAVQWDTHQPRVGFWPSAEWDELIRLNEGSNLMNTEIKFAERFQAFPALFTNARLPSEQIIGPDAAVEIEAAPGTEIYLEYKAASGVEGSLQVFVDWLKGFTEELADNWGVNLKVDGAGAADSGFKLTVEEIWNLETRQERIKSAESFERRQYRVVKAISDSRGYKLAADTLCNAEFPVPALPVNKQEEWAIVKEKIATKYMLVEDAWKKDDPDITEEAIKDRKAALGIGFAPLAPTFTDIVDQGGQT